MFRINALKTSIQQDYVDTPATTILSEPEVDSIPSLSPLFLHPTIASDSHCSAAAVQHHDLEEQDDSKLSVETTPHTDAVPYILRLMQKASVEIHFHRLAESWDGMSSELARCISLEKRLWAVSGLKRLTQHILGHGKFL